MAKKYILALDQGTTSCRSLLYNNMGQIVSVSQKPFSQIFPEAGWVEHDAEEIWETQLTTISEALGKASIKLEEIRSIGITNQRETTVLWNRKSGKPLHNAIVWQDKRTSEWCRQLITQGMAETINRKTGLVPDAYFSASKIWWILTNIVKGAVDISDVCFGTVDSWLLWKLTNGKVHATDVSNASRTMIYNIYNMEWDKELLSSFGIPSSILPTVKDSSYNFGIAEVDLFEGSGIPITGILGDQQAALYGQNCLSKGMAKNTYGTGCFILMNTGSEPVQSNHGLLTTIAWRIDGKITYALEGSVFNAGAAIDWFADNLNVMENVRESSNIAEEIGSSEGVYVIPAFSGLGSPYWDMNARAAVLGLSRKHGKAHIVRALLEAIAFRSEEVLLAMQKDASFDLNELKVDGGVSNNDFLMQFQSDILNVIVKRPASIESTALGAAKIAGQQFDFFKETSATDDYSFQPAMKADLRKKLITDWKIAVQRILS